MTTVDGADVVCPPRYLTEILIRQARELQMLPAIATSAIAIADDPDSRIRDLVTIIAQDVKLTTDIVSLSNSSLFGTTQSNGSLQQAIMRLGFRQTRNMIMASSITSMMQKMPWLEIRVRDWLCKHSFMTGVINSRLNHLFQMGLQGEEFTAGLVHDIGRTLLAVTIPEEFEKIDALDFNEPDDLLERELRYVGTTHAEVGAWFLQRNQVPEELITVARYHHSPRDCSRYKRLVVITAVADDMANFYGRQGAPAGYDCMDSANLELLETLGVENPHDRLQACVDDLMGFAADEVRLLIKS